MAKRLGQKALVVTSDRDVADYADSHGAVAVSSPEFEDKLVVASYLDVKGAEEVVEEGGWVPTTKKKGPKRRLSKKDRKKKVKMRKL